MSAIRDLIWDAIRQADHMLLTLCVAANLYGIALIYSATRWKVAFHSFPLKQGVAMLIGIGLYFVVSQFNIHLLMDKWRWVVLGCNSFSAAAAHPPWYRDPGATGPGSTFPAFPSTFSLRKL